MMTSRLRTAVSTSPQPGMTVLGEQSSGYSGLAIITTSAAPTRGSECHRDTSMQQHLPFFGLHTLAKLPHCKLSPPHLRWLLAAPACGAIDSNISAADSVTISIRMI